jgi:hypothetical protein
MGAQWLHDLPKILDGGPHTVHWYPGWELRSAKRGGFTDVRAIGIHHTASPISTTREQAVDRLWKIAPLRPVSNIYVDRDGSITVGAAGSANTMGKGGPLSCSRGRIPLDAGNAYMIAIEAGNNGIGEPWPTKMIDAYIWLCARLCDGYALDVSRDIFGHHGYCQPSCPGRKIDPRGPTPGYPTLGPTPLTIWSDIAFRQLVADLTEDDDMKGELIKVAGDSLVLARYGIEVYHLTNRHPVDNVSAAVADGFFDGTPRDVDRASYATLKLCSTIHYADGDPTPENLRTHESDFLQNTV